jgi:23S rRNA (uracil1939-C5)-methyltransferase
MGVLAIDERVEGNIETLAFGGEGILRYRGFVIFIPFTATGDRVVCRITHVKRSFAKGELVEILKPSQSRVQPRCPYFGTCGGCQLQHLNQEAQLKYKFNAVNDALKRIGHLDFSTPFPVFSSPPYWSYRRHVTLQLQPTENAFKAGYTAIDNQSLVIAQTCPIFNEPDQPILSLLQLLVSQLPNPQQHKGRVTLLKNHKHQFIVFFQFEIGFKPELKAFTSMLQKNPLLAGLLIQVPREKTLIFGDIYCEQEIEGLNFRFTPQAFIQNHSEQSSAIYRKICELAAQVPNRHILDLYCGFGITSSLLARQGHRVLGVEYNPISIEFAQANALKNRLKQVQFIAGSVEKNISSLLKKEPFDLILVNPPRTGLSKEVVHYLLKAQPRHLLYVSCMPSTLARDLQLICEQNYKLKEGEIYDMFPQTAHVETLVYLEKKEYNRSVRF